LNKLKKEKKKVKAMSFSEILAKIHNYVEIHSKNGKN
tara:strand:- start:245 stop:355 length:111 start_codon:yes stop_codon:yes gene_type:complete